MATYDASFEEGWGIPAAGTPPGAHADAVERGEIVPADRLRAERERRGIGDRASLDPAAPYVPWYEWRHHAPRRPVPAEGGAVAGSSVPEVGGGSAPEVGGGSAPEARQE